jgi:hypothetical protein
MAKKKQKDDIEISQEDIRVVEVEVENLDPDDDNIEIIGKNQEYSLTMYLDQDVDERTYGKFIRAVEKAVRSNDDYKLWLEDLRDVDQLSGDAFFQNISSSDAEIQLHHFPFNLYTVCSVITQKYMEENKKVSTFIIADKVLQEHFSNKIGLVPLTVTMHQLAHLNRLNITRKQIFGNWEQFYKEYTEYFSDFDIEIVRQLIERKALVKGDFLKVLEYKETNKDNT